MHFLPTSCIAYSRVLRVILPWYCISIRNYSKSEFFTRNHNIIYFFISPEGRPPNGPNGISGFPDLAMLPLTRSGMRPMIRCWKGAGSRSVLYWRAPPSSKDSTEMAHGRIPGRTSWKSQAGSSHARGGLIAPPTSNNPNYPSSER